MNFKFETNISLFGYLWPVGLEITFFNFFKMQSFLQTQKCLYFEHFQCFNYEISFLKNEKPFLKK